MNYLHQLSEFNLVLLICSMLWKIAKLLILLILVGVFHPNHSSAYRYQPAFERKKTSRFECSFLPQSNKVNAPRTNVMLRYQNKCNFLPEQK